MDYSDIAQEAAQQEYDPNEDRKLYIEKMENEGFIIVYPEKDELQIDIDTEEQYSHFLSQWEILRKAGYKWGYSLKESRNGLPGRHIMIVTGFDMDDCERIAWQACLGSDPKRELLSMIRLDRGDKHPTLFVEKA